MQKTALATTPAVLLRQAGWTPILNYVIQPDETGVAGATASSCLQLPEALSSVVLLHLALRLCVAFGLWNELFTMSIQFL